MRGLEPLPTNTPEEPKIQRSKGVPPGENSPGGTCLQRLGALKNELPRTYVRGFTGTLPRF